MTRRSPLLPILWLAISSLLCASPSGAQGQSPAEADSAAQRAEQLQEVQDRRELLGLQQRLDRAMRRGHEREVIALIEDLGKNGSPAAIEALLGFYDAKSPAIFDAARAQLVRPHSAEVLAALAVGYEAADGKGAWAKRVLILDALAANPGDAARTVLAKALSDRHPKVRLAASRMLSVAGGDPASLVPVSIDGLEAAERARDIGTPHLAARRALTTWTGYDHANARAWREFWAQRGSGFDFTSDKGDATEPAVASSVVYYKQPVTSRRVVFILDVSNSMGRWSSAGWPEEDKPDHPPAGSDRRRSRRGPDRSGGSLNDSAWIRWLNDHPLAVRIRRAKHELKEMVNAMPEHGRFNIIVFHSDVRSFKKGLIYADERGKTEAIRFIDSLEPVGATRADLALAEAFGENSEADTFYMLSDGVPSVDGKTYMPTEPILEWVRYVNRYHRITIHTLGFSASDYFLQPLAEQNGGTYTQVIGPP